MNIEQAHILLEKYNQGLATAEEKAWVENWFLDETGKYEWVEEDNQFLMLKDQIWRETLEKSGLSVKPIQKSFPLWPRFMAACVALLALAAGIYFYQSATISVINQNPGTEVNPGGNKATLTLGNGEKIILNDAANGEISSQAGISVQKTKDGELIYTVKEGIEDNGAVTINTISTPQGGQYTVILADGTKVMLNAASSLTFSTAFNHQMRQVELRGEAYFEVAKNKDLPFQIKTQLQTVEVLGTHFNINAYDDEPQIKTTLLEGSVKVLTNNGERILLPGQQSSVDKLAGSIRIVQGINTDKVIAWKNGLFSFENDDLKMIMRQISRWYNVKVEYSADLPDSRFFGEISRSNKLSEVCSILERYGVQFNVSGNVIRVSEASEKQEKK
ncbi:FecR family protein [Pedobacter nyackensis]|uniref:FecR family protein n=1 Tax=Pedobacter nyackensis TaxID=475255 RepID=UPI00292CBB00|nr:FecR family protein [Pedobacter nyackensis]